MAFKKFSLMSEPTSALELVTAVIKDEYIDPYHGFSNIVTFNSLLSTLKAGSFDFLTVVPYGDLYASAGLFNDRKSFMYGLTASWLQWKVYEALAAEPHLMDSDEISLMTIAAVDEVYYKKFRNLKLSVEDISMGEMFHVH